MTDSSERPRNDNVQTLERTPMTSTNALVPIDGTNGFEQHVTIDPTAPLRLNVSNASGDVKIVAADNPTVWIVVSRKNGEREDEAVGMVVKVDGNAINVHPDWTVASGFSGLARRIKDQLQKGFNPDDWHPGNLRLSPDLEYDIRVEIPRGIVAGSSVRVRTASGDVEAGGFDADVSLATASGDVRLASVTGRVSLSTASGDAHVSNVSDSLEMNTVSGDIHVGRADAWAALRSVSGDIRLSDPILRNARISTVSGDLTGSAVISNHQEYLFESVSGNVNLDATLPSSAMSSLSFRSLSGSAHVAGEWKADGKKNWTLGEGQPGPELKVKSVSGDLRLTGRTDSAVAARTEPLPSPAKSTSEGAADSPDMGDAPRTGPDLDGQIERAITWVKDAAATIHKPSPHHSTHSGHTLHPAPPVPPAEPVPSAGQAEPFATPNDEALVPTDAQATAPIANEEPGDAAEAEELNTNLAEDADSQLNRPTADSSDRLSVLEALERGEIDIDEALARIERDKQPDA